MSFEKIKGYSQDHCLDVPLNIISLSNTNYDKRVAKNASLAILDSFFDVVNDDLNLSIGYLTLNLDKATNGLSIEQYNEMPYSDKAKLTHKNIKAKVKEATGEVFLTKPSYSIISTYNKNNLPIFHCLFLRPNSDDRQRDIDYSALKEFIEGADDICAVNKKSKSQLILQALLYLFIKSDWLIKTNLYPDYIINARININSIPYYYLSKNKDIIELVEPSIYVNSNNEIITEVKFQAMQITENNDDNEDEAPDISGGLIQSYLSGTNSIDDDFLTNNYEQLISNIKTIKKMDARSSKTKNGHFISYQKESFLKSLSVYQSYLAKLIEDLFKNSNISYTRKYFKSDFRIRPFSKINTSERFKLLYIVDDFEFSDNKVKISDLLRDYLGSDFIEREAEADGEYLIISSKGLAELKKMYIAHISSYMKEQYDEIIVISSHDITDYNLLNSNAHYLFLQSHVNKKNYWYVANPDKINKFKEHVTKNNLIFLPPDYIAYNDKKERLNSSTKNFLALLDYFESDNFLTNKYTNLKLSNISSVITNKGFKVIQGMHVPTIKDIAKILAEKRKNEKIFSTNKLSDKHKLMKIANELVVKSFLSNNHKFQLINNIFLKDNCQNNLINFENVYKAYSIRIFSSEKRMNGKPLRKFLASEISVEINKNGVDIINKKIFTSENDLRLAQPLLNKLVVPSFYNDSFLLVSEKENKILIIYTSQNIGRLLPAIQLDDFSSLCKDVVDNKYQINKSQKGRVGLAFPYFFVPCTNGSSAWIYCQNHKEKGLTLLITNKDKPSLGGQKGIVLRNILLLDDNGNKVDVTNQNLIELYLTLTTFDSVRLNDFSTTTILEKLAYTLIKN